MARSDIVNGFLEEIRPEEVGALPDAIIPEVEDLPPLIENPLEFEMEEEDEYEQYMFDMEMSSTQPVVNHNENLAEHMEEADLDALSSDLIELYEQDVESRKDWEDIAKKGVNLLGFTIEELDEPFPGACGASHPVLAQSIVKFQAKAFRELFPSGGPARTRILGTVTPQREDQSKRVKEFLNYQTTIQMPEYGPQLDRLLFYTAFLGSGFKKTFYDPTRDRPVSKFVRAEDFIADYYTEDLESSERYTHRMYLSHNDLRKYQLSGFYSDIELTEPEKPTLDKIAKADDEIQGRNQPDKNDIYTIYEMHVNLDLPGFEDESGLRLPYIVSIEDDSQKILSVRRNWKEADPKRAKRTWFTHYCFIPGLGFYGYGYLHLIGGLAKTATSTMRQLIDAGTFANLPGGFKAHGLRVLAPTSPISPGEWREANAPAGDLSKSLIPLPYKEPSGTLMKLMDFVISTAKEFADTTDQVIAESSNYGPVGTTLALLEQSAKLFSAIHARMHAAQAHDLRLLAELNHEYLPNQYPYQIAGGAQQIFKEDFDLNSIDVVPVSDPNMPTEAHRVAKINAILQIAGTDPAAHNMQAIRMDLYRAMGVESPERYAAEQKQPFTGDPVAEASAAMVGTPLKAATEQNHDAHIAVHTSILENPTYAKNVGASQIIQAHINEHLAMKIKMDTAQLVGANNPELAGAMMSEQPLPPAVGNQIALEVANVSDEWIKMDKLRQDVLANRTQENDPQYQVAMRELDIKEKQVDNKYEIDTAKLNLNEAGVMIDDLNEDLDREARVKIAHMGAKNAASKNTS